MRESSSEISWGKSIPGRGNSQGKVGMCLTYLRNSRRPLWPEEIEKLSAEVREVTRRAASQSLWTVLRSSVFFSQRMRSHWSCERLGGGWRVVGEQGGVPNREISYGNPRSRAPTRELATEGVKRGQLQVYFDSGTNRRIS